MFKWLSTISRSIVPFTDIKSTQFILEYQGSFVGIGSANMWRHYKYAMSCPYPESGMEIFAKLIHKYGMDKYVHVDMVT